ncbi:MAG: NAD-dependent epimerase/dehydratase family protein [Gemmatimonadaceae bacterium]
MTSPIVAPPRALVLGANGFLGRWMARTLTAAGSDVVGVSRAFDDTMMRQWGIGGRRVALDLSDLESVKALVRRESPDVVFNLAGYGVDRNERDAATAERINAALPGALAEGCAELPETAWRGVRLVHIGSALEYGTTGGVLREDAPMAPTTLYGVTKLRGTTRVTEVARRTGLRAFTGRLFTVFGPGEHAGRLFPTLVAAAHGQEPIPLSSGTQTRDFAFAGDVAYCLLQLASSTVQPGEAVNVASGEMHTVHDFVLAAAHVLQIQTARLHFGEVAVRPEEMSHTGVSVDRLTTLTGAPLSSRLPTVLSRAVAAAQSVGWAGT